MSEDEIKQIIDAAKSRVDVRSLNWHNLEFAKNDRVKLLRVVEHYQKMTAVSKAENDRP